LVLLLDAVHAAAGHGRGHPEGGGQAGGAADAAAHRQVQRRLLRFPIKQILSLVDVAWLKQEPYETGTIHASIAKPQQQQNSQQQQQQQQQRKHVPDLRGCG
jgi:hypothetical protein